MAVSVGEVLDLELASASSYEKPTSHFPPLTSILGQITGTGGVHLLEILRPSLYVNSVARVSVAVLIEQGIKGLVIDLDNTLTLWNDDYMAPDVRVWFGALHEAGLKACLTSNNSPERGRQVVEELGLPAVFNCGKPRRRGLRRALEILGTAPQETALIGDQLFTDVLGGNRLGLYTILVKPISSHEFIGTRLVRRLERVVLRSLGGPE